MRPWPNSDIRALSFLSSSPIWAAAAASWGLEGSSLPYLVRIGILQVHTPYKTTKHVSLHVVDGIRGLSRTTCSEEEKNELAIYQLELGTRFVDDVIINQ